VFPNLSTKILVDFRGLRCCDQHYKEGRIVETQLPLVEPLREQAPPAPKKKTLDLIELGKVTDTEGGTQGFKPDSGNGVQWF
jgi:hypothetical protein